MRKLDLAFFITLFLVTFLLPKCGIIPTHATSPWETATLLAPDTRVPDGNFSAVVVGPAGNGIVVWVQSENDDPSLWASSSTEGKGWGPAILLETNAGPAFNPQIAMDGGGNAIVVWHQWDGTRNNIWANRYEVGEGWGIATLLELDNKNAINPQVAVDRGGDALALWSQSEGPLRSIWAKRYVLGNGWTNGTEIHEGPGVALGPQIAVEEGGNAFAVWSQSSGDEYRIWANRYDLEEGWGTAIPVENNPGDGLQPDIALGQGGSGMIVWRQFDGQEYSIYAVHFQPDTGWEKSILIEAHGGEARYPHVAADKNGHAVAVWYQRESGYSNVWSNYYKPSQGWTEAVKLGVKASDIQIVGNHNSHFLIVWDEVYGLFGKRWGIKGMTFDVNGGWGPSVWIHKGAGSSFHPQVAVGNEGDAIVVWEQIYEGQQSIWGTRSKWSTITK